ncbi:MAG: TVP38/TMEM64 family protein [Clostridium sp.]|nr:TVP38/TMEM64 family protein [Clostridium sp.]
MRKEEKKETIKFIIFMLLVMLSIVIVVKNWHFIRHLRVEKIVEYLRSKGPFATIIFLGIYAVKPFIIVMPSNIVAIVGGIIFGPVKGFLLSMLGFFISGTIAFYLSRILGKEFVQKLVGNKFMKLDDNMKNNGFKILFFLRLPPVLPYDPLSYACGFTNINYWAFIIASVLGVVPETLCYSIMGKNLSNPFSAKFIIPIVIVVLVTIFSKRIMSLKNS